MRVIGIDPGTAIVGYGIIDYDKNKYSIVDYGVVLTSKDLSTEERLEIVYDKIDKIEKELDMKALFEIKRLDFVETYFTKDVERTGVIAFNVKGVHSHDVSFILDSYDVAIRSGHHCAQPLMSYLDVPSCCRVSFSIYNDEKDVDKLIEVIRNLN